MDQSPAAPYGKIEATFDFGAVRRQVIHFDVGWILIHLENKGWIEIHPTTIGQLILLRLLSGLDPATLAEVS